MTSIKGCGRDASVSFILSSSGITASNFAGKRHHSSIAYSIKAAFPEYFKFIASIFGEP
jgi:hypothetical protein